MKQKNIMENISKEILKNTKPDPDMWIWYEGKLYKKEEAVKFIAALKNEAGR